MSFGEMMRQARREAGVTQRQLAEVTGVNHTYLSHIEADRATPSPRLISSIADFCQADVFEFCAAAGQVPAEISSALELLPAESLRRVYYGAMGELQRISAAQTKGH